MLSWRGLFLNGFDLSKNGTDSYYVSNRFKSCKVIFGGPMYYDSLESKWKRIPSKIFTVSFQTAHGIVLEVSFFYPRYNQVLK